MLNSSKNINRNRNDLESVNGTVNSPTSSSTTINSHHHFNQSNKKEETTLNSTASPSASVSFSFSLTSSPTLSLKDRKQQQKSLVDILPPIKRNKTMSHNDNSLKIKRRSLSSSSSSSSSSSLSDIKHCNMNQVCKIVTKRHQKKMIKKEFDDTQHRFISEFKLQLNNVDKPEFNRIEIPKDFQFNNSKSKNKNENDSQIIEL
jgi:hypothetical protein